MNDCGKEAVRKNVQRFPADENGRLLGLNLQHCCMQENVTPTGPWALLREQSAGAEFMLCEARLHS